MQEGFVSQFQSLWGEKRGEGGGGAWIRGMYYCKIRSFPLPSCWRELFEKQVTEDSHLRSGAPNNIFLSNPLKRNFRLSGVP